MKTLLHNCLCKKNHYSCLLFNKLLYITNLDFVTILDKKYDYDFLTLYMHRNKLVNVFENYNKILGLSYKWYVTYYDWHEMSDED